MGLAIFLVVFFVFGLNIARMWKVRTWVPDQAFRLLFINRQTRMVELLSVWSGLQEPKLVKIPDDVYITAVGGYGDNTVSGLLALGETDGIGERLLVDSLSFTLASPIHQAYWYSGESWSKWRLKGFLLRQGFLGQRSLPEAVAMMGLIDRVSWTTIEAETLGAEAGVRQRVELDGSNQNYFDPAILMAYLERNMMTVWAAATEVQVAVVNSSNMSQMAAVWSRIARVNGYDVVSVTDVPGQKQQTILIFSSQALKDSEAGRGLRALYPMATAEVGLVEEFRADVALLVGLDSWQWLFQRGAYLARQGR
jgi:hypothetical protein